MISQVITEMIGILGHDRAQMEHCMKVYVYATVIGEGEGLKGDMLRSLRTAAILHDIAIPEVIDKEGQLTEALHMKYGAPMVAAILHRLGYDRYIDRVAFLVANHHNYDMEMDRHVDLQMLIEADFLVKLSEGNCLEQPQEAYNRFFSTQTGRKLMKDLFL